MNESKIDWNEVWKAKMALHIESNDNMDCAQYWNKKGFAESCWNNALSNEQQRIRKIIDEIIITPKSRILDIGGGPGVLAFPLAKKVAHITVVEPSEEMASFLNNKIKETGITNISCVRKRWEDLDIKSDIDSPFDIIIASYSLGMLDIEKSIRKMDEVCKKYIYLYWFAGEPSWEKQSLLAWKMLYNKTYHPMPKCNILFNILYQMGKYPNISVYPLRHISKFSSLQEAIDKFGLRYDVETGHQRALLKKYLESILEKKDNYLYLRSYATGMKIWWKKE
jgi:ubiquinone/menaquinone biosynthesis C-methylase UbiE